MLRGCLYRKNGVNVCATAATNYSCCLTNFPFGSSSNPDSFPFADEDFVVPFTIGIVFPDYVHDLSACCLLTNCLLDR